MSTERIEVQRPIAADPATIFSVVSDPKGHVAIDSSGMLMSATGEPVRAVGDSFVVHMDREALNDFPLGLYDVTVSIVTFVTASPKTISRFSKLMEVLLVAPVNSRRFMLSFSPSMTT